MPNKVAWGSLAVIATLVVLKNGWLSALKARIQAETGGGGAVPKAAPIVLPENATVIAPTNASGETVGAPIAINPNG